MADRSDYAMQKDEINVDVGRPRTLTSINLNKNVDAKSAQSITPLLTTPLR